MARKPKHDHVHDHDRIAAKAHELWEADGRPHGRDQDHWDQAREMIAVEDSQADTLLPRDTGATEPVEDSKAALRNLADMPNLTDQGENLLTSTDREPKLTATPSGRKGRMPKAEVPTSDQPGIPPKARRGKATAPQSSSPPAQPVSADTETAAQPKTASVPKRAKPETVKADAPAPRKGGRKKSE